MVVLGGYLTACEHGRAQFPVIYDPSEHEVLSALSDLRYSSGVLSLQIRPAPEVGAYEVVLHSEGGRFLVMLSQYLEDGEHGVSTIRGGGIGSGLVSFSGEMYPAQAITDDFDLVCKAFKSFLQLETPSPDIWV
ncbi:hypothetical protein ACA097_19695 [Pseudomonas sp. QL9]|uniref:DUF6911 family protein n=1 Tax=Pseudomonas sp. QL9 TaxID=3242725 RepID=UPI00352ACD0E